MSTFRNYDLAYPSKYTSTVYYSFSTLFPTLFLPLCCPPAKKFHSKICQISALWQHQYVTKTCVDRRRTKTDTVKNGKKDRKEKSSGGEGRGKKMFNVLIPRISSSRGVRHVKKWCKAKHGSSSGIYNRGNLKPADSKRLK